MLKNKEPYKFIEDINVKVEDTTTMEVSTSGNQSYYYDYKKALEMWINRRKCS
jgi:hypothetical protein